MTAPLAWMMASVGDFALMSLFGVLSPYQYTLIVRAIMLGYVVFGSTAAQPMTTSAKTGR